MTLHATITTETSDNSAYQVNDGLLSTAQKMRIRSSLRQANITFTGLTTDFQLLDAVRPVDVELFNSLTSPLTYIEPAPAPAPTLKEVEEMIPAPTPTPTPTPAAPTPDAMAALTAALGQLMPAPTPAPAIDEEQLIRLIKEHATTKLEVTPANKTTPITIEGAHTKLKTLVTLLSGGALVYIHGPAGSGKTTLAMQAAEALDLDFYATGSVLAAYEVLGTLDAHGKYHETELYKAFKYGGVMLFDEIDGCTSKAIVAINRLIDRGCKAFTFPNGETCTRHPDFKVIAAANTIGAGATREYSGRSVMDGSSLDRFQFVRVDYDKRLELRIAKQAASAYDSYDEELTADWVSTVVEWREAARQAGVNCIISPRASIEGAVNLALGLSQKETLETCVIKGMSRDTVKQLEAIVNA